MTTPRFSKTLYFSVPPEMALRIETEAKTRRTNLSAFLGEVFRA